MKRVLNSPLFFILAGLSMTVQAQPEFVEVVADSCEMVVKAECHAKGYSGTEECREQFAEEAESEGADTILVTSQDQYKTRKPSLSGGMQVIDNTKMKADLYRCNEVVAASPEVKAQALSVEERLLRLNELRNKELISDDEYRAGRERILNDL